MQGAGACGAGVAALEAAGVALLAGGSVAAVLSVAGAPPRAGWLGAARELARVASVRGKTAELLGPPPGRGPLAALRALTVPQGWFTHFYALGTGSLGFALWRTYGCVPGNVSVALACLVAHAARRFLEAAFNQEPNPSEEQRQAFAAQLNLTKKQVRNWFQNKRQRLKGRATQHHNSKLASANEDLAEEYAELKIRNREAERENKVLRAQIKKLAAKLEDLQDSTSLLLIQYYKTRGQMEEGQAPPLPAGLSKIGSALGGAPPPAAGAETQPRTPLDPPPG